jgi:peptidoglycan hydrolase-like protein with peptidoglycan-binding domain
VSFNNFRQHSLTIGNRHESVRTVKRLLRDKLGNSFKDDGTNQYTPDVAGAISALQQKHGLPVTGQIGQNEYWLLAKNTVGVRLDQLSGNNQTLNKVLHGGVLGSALAKSNSFSSYKREDFDVGYITINRDYFVDFSFNERPTCRRFAEDRTKKILNDNSGSLATNVHRAIFSVQALNSYPTVKTKIKFEGGVKIEGGISGGSGKVEGKVGGAIELKGSYEREYDSPDVLLRDLQLNNEIIRANTVRAIWDHTISVPNPDPNISDVVKTLRETPASDAKSMALSFVNEAAKRANEIAREIYEESGNKSVPPQFSGWIRGDIIF